MKVAVFESISELILLIGSAIGTVAITTVGALAEQAGIQNVLTGHLVLGAWELWMGTSALIAGLYLLGYQEFWHRLQGMRHEH